MFKVFKDKKFLTTFLSVAFPVMIQQLITFFVSLVDTMMVSGISNEAVSSVYAVNQLSFFMFVVIGGIIAGSGIFIQQFFGSKDNDRLIQTHRYKLVAGIVFLIIALPIAFLFGHYVIEFYSRNNDNPQQILSLAKEYMPLILLGFIPYVFTASYSTSLRETGKTVEPMIASSVAVVINITLNYIFIFLLGLGVFGAALATFIARTVEMVTLLIIAEKRRFLNMSKIVKGFKIEPHLVRMITKNSLPLLGNEILWAGGMVLISLAYAQRSNVLSALSIVSTMGNIFMIVFLGLSVGISVMVGNSLGANKIHEARENVYKLYVLGVVVSLAFGLIMAAFSPLIPYLFVEVSLEQKALATQLITVYASFLWAFSLSTGVYMTLRAGGKSLLTFLLDSGTMWGIVVPLAWILARFTSLPLVWIYVAVQAFDIIKCGIGLVLIKRGTWIKNLTLEFQVEA